MSYTQRFSEVHELLASISPQAANGAVGEHNTGYVYVGNFHRAFIELTAGEPGGASTINVDVEEGTDVLGTGAQNIAGKTIAQLVAADAGETVFIEIRNAELDVPNRYDWINAEVVVGIDTYTYDLKVWGVVPRFPPVATGLIAQILG